MFFKRLSLGPSRAASNDHRSCWIVPLDRDTWFAIDSEWRLKKKKSERDKAGNQPLSVSFVMLNSAARHLCPWKRKIMRSGDTSGCHRLSARTYTPRNKRDRHGYLKFDFGDSVTLCISFVYRVQENPGFHPMLSGDCSINLGLFNTGWVPSVVSIVLIDDFASFKWKSVCSMLALVWSFPSFDHWRFRMTGDKRYICFSGQNCCNLLSFPSLPNVKFQNTARHC